MSRNEEKHVIGLNRLLLQQQREDELKKNPVRPKLVTLNTKEELVRWIPSIKRDLDFYLKQSQVPCYPERKINEFHDRIARLEREYRAFVKRLKELDPGCEAVPWTERPYSQRTTHAGETVADSAVRQGCAPRVEEDEQHSKQSDNKNHLERIPLPILESETEQQYAKEKQAAAPPVYWNCNPDLIDQPLKFETGSDVTHKYRSKIKSQKMIMRYKYGLFKKGHGDEMTGERDDGVISDRMYSAPNCDKSRTDRSVEGAQETELHYNSNSSSRIGAEQPRDRQEENIPETGQRALPHPVPLITKIASSQNPLHLDYDSSSSDAEDDT